MLSGMSKRDFLARATEIFDQKGSDCEAFCPICFKMFLNWQDKERHVKSVHENDESGKFKCLSCNKTFMSKSTRIPFMPKQSQLQPAIRARKLSAMQLVSKGTLKANTQWKGILTRSNASIVVYTLQGKTT